MDKFRVNLRKKMDKYIKLNGISYEYFSRTEGLTGLKSIRLSGNTSFKTLFETAKFLNVDIRNFLIFDDSTYIFKNSFDTFEEFFIFLGKRFKNFRNEKKISLNEFMEKFKKTIIPRDIYGFEGARRKISLSRFYDYLNVLEMTPEEFFLKDEQYEIKDISEEEIITLDDFNNRIYEIEEINGRELGKSVLYNFGELPTLHVFLKICKSLKVSPRDFFNFDNKDFKNNSNVIDISNSFDIIKQKLELNGFKVQRYIKLDAIFLFCKEQNILIKDLFDISKGKGNNNHMDINLFDLSTSIKVS